MADTRIRNFREAVLDAYDRRCAVTGLQLGLVQAVHILPASAPGSMDVVQNGIALSPTYRIAYDNGLIYLDEQLKMRLNEERAVYWELPHFVLPLGEIIKPVNNEEWPNLEFVGKANEYRGIDP